VDTSLASGSEQNIQACWSANQPRAALHIAALCRLLISWCAVLPQVQFGSIPDEVVDQLVAEEATYSCAGGLMVEHPLVAPLITAQFGEQASIMGLPKGVTLELLHKAALMGQPKRTVK
jgi:predicted house-cleaning NTP pyrophosphatase (Maf/HAM1 superfamily)